MKLMLFILAVVGSVVLKADQYTPDSSLAPVVQVAQSHDALYFDRDFERTYISWQAPSQKLIPFPLELIYHDSFHSGLHGAHMDSSDMLEYFGNIILSNLEKLNDYSPAILRMERHTVQNMIASH